VVLDAPEILTPWNADIIASCAAELSCDGILISPYIGTDAIKPFVPAGKDLFVVVRSPNKTASELQDLLTGSRLVHMAAADMVNRYAENLVGRSGYSQLGVVAAASTASCLRNLRAAYKSVFMLLDGYDYPNANAKNCSNAFDKLGHGAAAIAGVSIAAAWREEPANEREFVRLAVEAANRMKKNLLRYITIL
jgi:orotidine-5'-phosphate decarboxylase